jgi:Tol biopolymer transport system component
MNISNKRRLLTGSCIGILCVLLCMGFLGIRLVNSVFPMSLSSPKPAIAQPLGEGEALAFSYMRLDPLRPFELYILDDANGLRSISQGLVRSDIGPVWSPDGERIVYESVSGGSSRYYLVEADGGERREISSDERHKGLLRWSEDGSRLAYLAYDRNPNGSISNTPYLCVTEVTTGDTRQAQVGNIQDFVWTEGGQSLLAIERGDDLVSIEMYAANGEHKRRVSVAETLRDAVYIAISPDASKVAYLIPGADEDNEPVTVSLYVSAIDGSATKFIGTLWAEGSIVWSPDSSKIAFVALTDDYEYALYVADANGAELRELMPINTGDESGEILPPDPAWSSDSARIAIASLSGGEGSGVFVMNADGAGRRQVVAIPDIGGMIYNLAWKPGK